MADEKQKETIWKGVRYDEKSGKWEVYITKRYVEVFDNVESALNYVQKG